MKRRVLSFLTAAALAASLGIAGQNALAQANALPAGTYSCVMLIGTQLVDFGELQIDGTSYRGPALGGDYTDGWYNYQLDAAGAVFWDGPVGPFTSDGNSISFTEFSTDSQGNGVVRITILSAREGTQEIDCQL